MPSNRFSLFSKEIHLKIASWLDLDDVVNYQTLCKATKRILNLHCLNKPSSVDLIREFHGGSRGRRRETNDDDIPDDIIKIGQIIVTGSGSTGLSSLYFNNLIHSIRLSCYYKDQGWGNRKGYIYIAELNHRKNSSEGEDEDDVTPGKIIALEKNLDRIVSQSPLATHNETKCELVFQPKPEFSYALCYKIGGGGGHELHLRDINMVSFVHSPCIPLANIVMAASSPSASTNFFFRNMLQYILDTVEYFDTYNDESEDAQKEIDRRRPSLLFFSSVGLDLKDEQDIEAVRILLAELE